jgi:predicted flap endonuclease-1-like 5' DNA nuclease
MANLMAIEGIGQSNARKLQAIGIDTTYALTTRGASPQGREEIARLSGIDQALIQRWINHVDLLRISGVGEEYAELLEAAGVETVKELAQLDPVKLYRDLIDANQGQRQIRHLPSQSQVGKWVEEAVLLSNTAGY